MKAFEKWRKQQEKRGIEVGFDYANAEGWKAALEWMLGDIDYADSPENLRAKIKNELEEANESVQNMAKEKGSKNDRLLR